MKFPVIGLLVLLALTVAACAPVLVTKLDRLVFQPEIYDDVTGEFVISLKVRNDGDGRAPARPNANALMELRDEHGLLRASAHVTSLIAIDPGVILDPAAWRGRLDPGFYQLYWGAPGLGHTQMYFVVDEVDGRPQVGDMRIAHLPEQDMPTLPAYGDAQPLVDLAIAQLAGQLDVAVEMVRVERVEPVDFPDASLGAPQPDMMYAQVITPGYVITLSYQGLTYVFHAGGQQVVLVSPE